MHCTLNPVSRHWESTILSRKKQGHNTANMQIKLRYNNTINDGKFQEVFMRKSVMIVALVLLSVAIAIAGPAPKVKSLTGLKQVKFVVDVNVGNPKLLVTRMELLNRTYQQLASAGMKPVIVVAFRGRASLFITKGEGYVDPEEKNAKLEMKSWIERFKQAGFQIEQCAIAAGMLNIDVTDFLPQVEVVENGYVSLIGYQLQGYAFLPMD